MEQLLRVLLHRMRFWWPRAHALSFAARNFALANLWRILALVWRAFRTSLAGSAMRYLVNLIFLFGFRVLHFFLLVLRVFCVLLNELRGLLSQSQKKAKQYNIHRNVRLVKGSSPMIGQCSCINVTATSLGVTQQLQRCESNHAMLH